MVNASTVFSSDPIMQMLGRAIAQGVALASLATIAGCSSEVPDPNPPVGTPDGGKLEPYDAKALACWGPSYDGGYYGQCCVKAHCYTPEAGQACMSADSVWKSGGRSVLPNFPPGSGSCACRLGPDSTESISGPFAPNAGDTPASSGSCCYLVGGISCTGRPLVVGGALVIAELVSRTDWAPFA